jgi:ribosomal protein S18 acetylase RimI-like enzyme
LVEVEPSHLAVLRSWWSDAASVLAWAGPRFRYPFDEVTFREDLRLEDCTSRILLGRAGEVLGFGQFYLREERVHLARLAVAPGVRGAGIGGALVRQLLRLGDQMSGRRDASLFVLASNQVAWRCYAREGFEEQPLDPQDVWIEELLGQKVLFMVQVRQDELPHPSGTDD